MTEISKKTGISIGLISLVAAPIFLFITAWARLQFQTESNTAAIATLSSKLDTVNDNLNKTNGNIIELNTRLDSLTGRENTTRVEVAPQHTSAIVFTQSTDGSRLQPSSASTASSLQPQSQKENPTPADQDNPQEPARVSSLVRGVLGLVGLSN